MPSPRSPSNKPRQQSATPSKRQSQISQSPENRRSSWSGGAIQNEEPLETDKNQSNKFNAKSQRSKVRRKKKRPQNAAGMACTHVNQLSQTVINNRNNGSNRSRKKTVKVETDQETMQRQKLYGTIIQISGNAGVLTSEEPSGLKAHTKVMNHQSKLRKR